MFLVEEAMEIVTNTTDLEKYMKEAVDVSDDSPILLDKFLNDAIEVDIDLLVMVKTFMLLALWNT